MRPDGASHWPFGYRKAQLIHLIETIMRRFREHDEIEYKKSSLSMPWKPCENGL